MAGPEDGTTSGQHGHATDTSDPFRLQGNDVVPDEECQCGDHQVDDLKPQSAVTLSSGEQPDARGNQLRIAFRHGNRVNSASAVPDERSDKKTSASQQSCENDDESDVFDVESHAVFFSLEGTDEDVDEDDDKESDLSAPGKDPFLKSVLENDERDAVLCALEDSEPENTAPEGEQDGALPQDDTDHPTSVQGRRERSHPQPIPIFKERETSSSIMTVCRHFNSQLVFRCQVNSCNMRVSSSCPAAFSSRWPDVVSRGSTARGCNGEQLNRKRRNTVASGVEPQQPASGSCRDHDLVQDDLKRPALPGRSRSYSESDMQRLLMREVGRELRRLSDEFVFSRKQRKLATVSESASEDDVW